MSLSCTFEKLPDEILLLIYRYLSSTDILFSFFGLNSRLTQTITGFCRHVVIAQVPFMQFTYISTSILPEIGAYICSLVVGNDWKGALSKLFLSYFGEKMSVAFPRLKHLILTTFRIGTIISFLDCLQNLPELFELKVISLYDMKDCGADVEILLQRILTANNNQLTSIMFDDDSLSFPYKYRNDVYYPHVEKLVIELKTLNDLHQLLTVLPRLKFLDAAINEEYSEPAEEIQYIPMLALRHFRLRSFVHYWNLDELVLILQRIPKVQELIIQISTSYDARLIDGQLMFSHLSSFPLTKFSYFLQFENSSSIDDTNILPSWQQFNQEFICIKSDDDDTLALCTLPFDCPYLFLRCPLAKNKIFSDSYGFQVRCLTLYDVSARIAEVFSIISKCRKMECLILRVDETIEQKSFPQISLGKLTHLTCFVSLNKPPVNVDDFIRLCEMSPNLYHLAVNYTFIEPMFDNESVCYLLQRHITHLLIALTSITNLESVTGSVSRLASMFPFLRHLYFDISINDQSGESLMLSVLNHLHKWSLLVSFGVANITMDSKILSKGIREWVLENSFLNDRDPFIIDYSAQTFRLWL